MGKITYSHPEIYGFREIGKSTPFRNLSMTDIWRSKFEGNRFILDPSLSSAQK